MEFKLGPKLAAKCPEVAAPMLHAFEEALGAMPDEVKSADLTVILDLPSMREVFDGGPIPDFAMFVADQGLRQPRVIVREATLDRWLFGGKRERFLHAATHELYHLACHPLGLFTRFGNMREEEQVVDLLTQANVGEKWPADAPYIPMAHVIRGKEERRALTVRFAREALKADGPSTQAVRRYHALLADAVDERAGGGVLRKLWVLGGGPPARSIAAVAVGGYIMVVGMLLGLLPLMDRLFHPANAPLLPSMSDALSDGVIGAIGFAVLFASLPIVDGVKRLCIVQADRRMAT